jgi:hypothetical protein
MSVHAESALEQFWTSKSQEAVPFVAVCTGSQGICYELALKGLGTEIKYDI